ncbi:MAG: hypothetical protein OXE40_03785, partial [Gammaproteobacteria bacterium]|nr:hypothetical protein [Gammaproteobacteria bacterium]
DTREPVPQPGSVAAGGAPPAPVEAAAETPAGKPDGSGAGTDAGEQVDSRNAAAPESGEAPADAVQPTGTEPPAAAPGRPRRAANDPREIRRRQREAAASASDSDSA